MSSGAVAGAAPIEVVPRNGNARNHRPGAARHPQIPPCPPILTLRLLWPGPPVSSPPSTPRATLSCATYFRNRAHQIAAMVALRTSSCVQIDVPSGSAGPFRAKSAKLQRRSQAATPGCANLPRKPLSDRRKIVTGRHCSFGVKYPRLESRISITGPGRTAYPAPRPVPRHRSSLCRTGNRAPGAFPERTRSDDPRYLSRPARAHRPRGAMGLHGVTGAILCDSGGMRKPNRPVRKDPERDRQLPGAGGLGRPRDAVRRHGRLDRERQPANSDVSGQTHLAMKSRFGTPFLRANRGVEFL